MLRGRITRLLLRNGYGFIASVGAVDTFFNSPVVEGIPFAELREGQEVEFLSQPHGWGTCPQATLVRSIPSAVGVDQSLADAGLK